MRSDGLWSGRGLASALLLGLAGVALGWLCFRAAIVQVLPPTSPVIVQFAPHDPDVVFGRAAVSLLQPRATLSPAMLDEVRRAAAAAPLDARPYLILGRHELASDPDRATATLEAGQRLDPRQRFIHALLLERYLRSAQYGNAAEQFSVLARLVDETQQPIAKAVALMSAVPAMREPVRRTLGTDPRLEQSVLSMLAQGDAAPASIFGLASPSALAHAGDKNGWGSALVARLVANGRYDDAHSIWQRIYHLSDADIAAPIFNAGFAKLPASPPFNWDLVAGSVGAADPRSGSLAVAYYGRDSGDLAGQLLLLAPGRYQFSFVAEGGKSDPASSLSWLLTCASGSKAGLMNAAVVPGLNARRIFAALTVPANCPAQMLTLHGEAGEFPVPVETSIRDLALRRASGARS